MTTATTDPPEQEEAERIFTERELAKQEETLADLRERLAELRTRDGELEAEIADRMAEEEDVSDLRERRTEIRETLEELEGIPEILEARIRERRQRAVRERARERLQSIRKKVGGICGEAPRRAEKAAELAEKLVRQLTWLAGFQTRRSLLREEARFLAARFDLEVPELAEPDVQTAKVVVDTKRQIRAVSGPGDRLVMAIRRRIQKGEHQEAAATVARQLDQLFGDETPTPDLIDALEGTDTPEGS